MPPQAPWIARFEGKSSFYCLALSPDGKSLVAGDEGGLVHLFDVVIDAADKAGWMRNVSNGRPQFMSPGAIAPDETADPIKLILAEARRSLARVFAGFAGKRKR